MSPTRTTGGRLERYSCRDTGNKLVIIHALHVFLMRKINDTRQTFATFERCLLSAITVEEQAHIIRMMRIVTKVSARLSVHVTLVQCTYMLVFAV